MAKKKGLFSDFFKNLGNIFKRKKKAPDRRAPAKKKLSSKSKKIIEETRKKLEKLEQESRIKESAASQVKNMPLEKPPVPTKEEFLGPLYSKKGAEVAGKKEIPTKEEFLGPLYSSQEKPVEKVFGEDSPRTKSKFERSFDVEKIPVKKEDVKERPKEKIKTGVEIFAAKKISPKKNVVVKKAEIKKPKVKPKSGVKIPKKVIPEKIPAKVILEKKPEPKPIMAEKPVEEKPKSEKMPVEKLVVERAAPVAKPAPTRPAPMRSAPMPERPMAASVVSTIQNFDEQISITKELIKSLNMDFFKRRITEEEYRRKTLEYREKMKLLEIRRRNVLKAQSDGAAVAQAFRPVTAAETRNAVSQTKVHQILKAKARGKIDDHRLNELENKLTELAKRYNLSEKELEQDVLDIDTSKTIESFNKLVSLIDLEREANRRLDQVRIVGVPKAFKESAKEVEAIKGIATEIKKHRIVTDFDKIVAIVGQQGKLKLSELSAQLKIDKRTCSGLLPDLEKEGLLEIKYPAFGEVSVQLPGYDDMQKVLKEKKKAEDKARKLQENQKKKNK
ncbi:MAG: hypothetical protein ABID38_05140 [Candidatus Diapherotrites archaeon]